VLLRRRILSRVGQAFRPAFLTAEDQDFFRRMIEKGHRFIWCNEAVAYEIVPPDRWKRSFMLRRALLRGKISIMHPTFGARDVAKSLLAVPVYALALPFALLVGQHCFMNCLVKLFDHGGKILAMLGMDPVKDAYVTE
jgi:cellulose synthase/poly-beta-1,6-N-acetylglucosamine synthase-like glycosyltransferase